MEKLIEEEVELHQKLEEKLMDDLMNGIDQSGYEGQNEGDDKFN